MDQPLTGLDCHLYYNSATHDAPSWHDVVNAKDISDADTLEKVDVSAKYSRRKRYAAGQGEGGIKFDYVYIKGTDAVFTALQTAFVNRTPLEFLTSDGPINVVGTVFHKDYFLITDFSRTQPLNGGFLYSVELAPAVVFNAGSIVEESYGTVS